MQKDIELKADSIDKYKLLIDKVWRQVIRLNENLLIVKNIKNFPFHLFAPFDKHFWTITYANTYESILLIIYKLVFDKNSRSLTFNSLETKVSEYISPPNIRKFKKSLSEYDIKSHLNDVKDDIENIRHKHVAHFDTEFQLKSTIQEIAQKFIGLEVLEQKIKIINGYFDLFCVDSGRAKLTVNYYLSENTSGRKLSDIERLLDLIAQNSKILNMPEEQPEYWPLHKEKNLSAKNLETINRYRKRFGLNEVI